MKRVFLKILVFSVCMSVLATPTSSGLLTASANEDNEPSYSDICARGVWHRPNSSGRETNLEGLCSVLDEMANAGINLIFLESFYHGMTVFKTNLVPYYTGFEEFDFGEYPDYLTAFAAEAQKRGIEVHAWVECFYLGVNESTPLVKYYPRWLLVNESGKTRHSTEGAELGGYIFFDPANNAAREYLLRFFEEMLRKVPDIKGLNLDYIRYPVSDFYSGTDSGYTDAAMTEFAEKYGLSVTENNKIQDFKTQIKSNSLVDEWTDYRAGKVTSFVKQVSEMVNEKHSDCIISVAVHPDVNSAYNQKKQDFLTWVKEGYIDVVTPMVYYYDSYQISSALRDMLAKFKGVYCYSGLYTTYHNQSTTELEKHISASENSGADGFVLFEAAKTFFNASYDYSGYLSDKYPKKSAISALPHWSADKLIEATTDIIANMLTEKGISDESVKSFINEMEAIKLIGERSEDAIVRMIDEITRLKEHKLPAIAGESSYSDAEDALNMLIERLEVRKARLSFKGYADDLRPPEDDNNSSDEDMGESENNGSLDEEDSKGKKGFWDVIKMLIDKIVNWFKNLFVKPKTVFALSMRYYKK